MSNIIIKVFSVSLSSFFLFACQSTTAPDWYTKVPTNEPGYITSVGQGRSLHQAKMSALSQINAQLWVQVESSFSSQDTYRSTDENLSSNSLINNQVNSNTEKVTFADIEYPLIDKNDAGYFVQAKVRRTSIIKQLKSDIHQVDQVSRQELDEKEHQNPLLWWLENRNLKSKVNLVSVRQSMLRAMNISDIPSASYLDKLVSNVSQTQSKIIIYFVMSKSDKKAVELLADNLSKEGIKVTFKKSPSVTHTLRINTELRQSIVGSTYVSTQLTSLKLQDNNGVILASNEIISTGNSLTNYSFSKEGAQRHLISIVEEQGVWKSFGINIQ